MNHLISSAEAARILGVHPTTLSRWGREGRIWFTRTSSGAHAHYYFRESEIRTLVDRRGGLSNG